MVVELGMGIQLGVVILLGIVVYLDMVVRLGMEIQLGTVMHCHKPECPAEKIGLLSFCSVFIV